MKIHTLMLTSFLALIFSCMPVSAKMNTLVSKVAKHTFHSNNMVPGDDSQSTSNDNEDNVDEDEAEDESDPRYDPDPEADVLDSGTPRAHET